ncbi:MAG TPA: DoxX family protein [Acidobacteriaceae bacterium]|nr:DoxX family protein [Acidobacteriaceae bacterium]
MQSDTPASLSSKQSLWAGRILSVLVVLFLVFDSVGKFVKPVQVVEAFARLGMSIDLSVTIGTLLLICTILYAIPRTAFHGAILLTGYLGGAVAIQLRVGNPVFETVFPALFGVLVWAGLFLRDDRLRILLLPRS